MNNGRSWESKELRGDQSFAIPKKVTNLLVDNIPYAQKNNYEIRDGHVANKSNKYYP